ncbi:restriction endonuclease subunit S [Pseudoalteromonas sp. GW168-MNA-CIBAN-0100]|uniref:restriction endonuclease subunit S n=1 Tax=Pseudoalteromonas sp. GW168-MNA-CIBAN-0100 TaxID=3140434 RepID=UPI003325F576
MKDLPKGWISASLGDIANVQSGVGFPKKYQGVLDAEYPVYKVGDVSRAYLKNKANLYIAENTVSEETANLLKGKIFNEGSVLFAKIGEALKLNRRVIVTKSGLADNNVMGVTAKLKESEKYIYRFLQYFDVASLSRSTTVPSIRKSDVEEILIPFPPLNEQIRIADKLDSILAKVNKAQSRLDKIPAILKRFRQSVLAAATSGELTKEWREFNKVDKGSWQQFSIDELSSRAFDGPFGSKLKTADYTEFGVKVVRLENIGHLTFKGDKETFISEKKYQDLIKNTLEHNDILFSSFVDEEIRTCLFEARDNTYINKADCFCIRVSGEKISPKFLMYNLGCKHTFDKIKKQVHGVTRPRINLRFLKSFEVSVPTIEEQIRIVEIIDALFHKAAKVEAQFLETKSKLDRLTQSILAKAFRGELVSQSDKDESAEALLKRIKVESPKVKSNK